MPGPTIRPETVADAPAVRRVNVEAFRGHPLSRQTEHLIVEALRAADALAVSLVAELYGAVVGHIAFSRAEIGDEDGSAASGGDEAGWYLLGPVAVLPDHQGRGIGRALVEGGLATLRAEGAGGCVLVGDPAFYARFGFEQASGVTWPGVPPENLLCVRFSESMPVGEVAYHPAFTVEPE